MKTIVLFLITLYKMLLSPLFHALIGQTTVCRYEQTCSSYAKEQIERFGIIKGSRHGLFRLLTCQPFFKGGTI